MELKISLLRSNPAVIRQIVIPGKMSLELFQKAALITMGWMPEKAYGVFCIDSDGDKCGIFDTDISLNDLFQNTDTLYISYARREKTGKQREKTGWIFRIQCLGLEENAPDRKKEEEWKLVRYRGLNPPQGLDGTAAWNRLQKFWESERTFFYHWEFGNYRKKDQEVHIRRINRDLDSVMTGEYKCTQ